MHPPDLDSGALSSPIFVAAQSSGCGRAETHLDVQNRTTAPIVLTVDSESGGTRTLVPFIPACGSVMFMWNGVWVPADPAEPGPGGSRRRRSDRDPNHLTPPPDGSGSVTKTLIVSEAGVDGYSAPNQAPSMPPCQGRPPVD